MATPHLYTNIILNIQFRDHIAAFMRCLGLGAASYLKSARTLTLFDLPAPLDPLVPQRLPETWLEKSY